jgi:hypothetical protein
MLQGAEFTSEMKTNFQKPVEVPRDCDCNKHRTWSLNCRLTPRKPTSSLLTKRPRPHLNQCNVTGGGCEKRQTPCWSEDLAVIANRTVLWDVTPCSLVPYGRNVGKLKQQGCSDISSVMNTEAVCYSETSVSCITLHGVTWQTMQIKNKIWK